MIKKAKLVEIPQILELTKVCGEHLADQGIYQWNENYPTEKTFKTDIARGELYVLFEQETLIGVIALSTFMDPEYESVSWLSPNENNLYVHRLAITPAYQGKGFAQRLMSFAESHARNLHYTSIRLDTFSQNKRNQAFYEQRGYTRLEEVYFPMQSDLPFYCYELILK
ncbi:MAG: GNAT family N-acetyltransferase [Eudoraea sp.]|nr:GNAT family N-acetyltransferase [Eudoraea sp.]